MCGHGTEGHVQQQAVIGERGSGTGHAGSTAAQESGSKQPNKSGDERSGRDGMAAAEQQHALASFGIIGERDHIVVPSVVNGQGRTTLIRNGVYGGAQGGFAALGS